MIENYIFDFGQVIVNFDTEHLTSIYIKEPRNAKIVEKVVFDRKYFDKLDAGLITDDEVKREYCSRLPEKLQKDACKVYDNWYRNLTFIDGMPELLKQIKANGGKLFLLSNISLKFANNYMSVPKIKEVLDIFDGLVFSAPIGITKPSKEIFEHILHKYSLNAKECVFVDDNFDNVLGAQNIGIKAYEFDGKVDKLRSFLFSFQ